MKSTSFLAAIVGAAYIVSAQQATGPVSITQPLQGTTWGIGSSETVTWQNVQDGVTSLLINLMKGDPNALTLVQALASNVDPKSGSTQVEIPQNVTEGTDYSLAVGTDPSKMAYIGGIIISNSASNSTSDNTTSTDGTADGSTVAQSNVQQAGNSTVSLDNNGQPDEGCSPPSGAASAAAPSGIPSSNSSDCSPPSGGSPSGASETLSGTTGGFSKRQEPATVTSAAGGAGASVTSAASDAGAFVTSAVGGAGASVTSAGASVTSAAGGAGASVTSAAGGAGVSVTSAAGEAGASVTSAASGAGASDTGILGSLASGSVSGSSSPSSSGSSSSSTSGATRNLISGLLMAVPAALVAMTGF